MTIRSKPKSCEGCQCYGHGNDFSAVEGTGSLGVLLCGEASGEHEQRDCLPFRPYAPAGGVLTRILRRMGLSREQFAITNAIRCRPSKNFLDGAPWEYSALAHCRPNLDAAIAQFRPRAIQSLGGIATRELTGMAGEAQGIGHLAGYVLPAQVNTKWPAVAQQALEKFGLSDRPAEYIPVIPNFHPAYLRRGKASHQGVFARYLQRAINVASGCDHDYLWHVDPSDRSTHGSLEYLTHPSLEEARSYARRVLDSSGSVVSYDIETFESASLDEDARDGFSDTNIRLIQFSAQSGGGIAFPWEGEFIAIAQSILHSDNVKCGHNVWLFDNKVLRAAGEREGLDLMPRGVIHDTLAMFHHWQPDLPAHLQFAASFVSFPFPWKHLAATDIEFYGICDVDATLRLFTFLDATLRKDGLYGDDNTGYLGQVFEVRPVLAAMEDRGMPIDNAARIALGDEFKVAQDALEIEIQALVPDGIGRVHPKEGYKGVPPEVKKWYANADPSYSVITLKPEAIYDVRFLESGDDGESYHYTFRQFEEVEEINGQLTIQPVVRWCRIYDFNPNSRNQVFSYMDANHHKRPKSRELNDEGESKDSAAAKELERLTIQTGDTFYLKVRDYKGLTKMRGTYVDGFAPAVDGCVHTSFTFLTGIGQLGSRSPNVQNFPKLKPTIALAKAMRRMVAAKPGHILTEWDFKSCHIITLGYLSGDQNYLRLGRLDMHSFVAGHFLGLWDGRELFHLSDDELRAKFKWLKSIPEYKKVRDDQAKHGILGIGNGLQAKGLYERYIENFPPRVCPLCKGIGQVAGVHRMKKCATCDGSGQQSGRAIADEVLEVAGVLFPKVRPYQDTERKTAHEKRELRTPFGHIRRFYEVFQWDSRKRDKVTGMLGGWSHGDQSEEAVAFRLANIAFGHIREKLKELAAAGLDQRYGLFNNIHDSFLFHFPESMLEQHIAEIYPVLTSPSAVLRDPVIAPNGLVIDVEGVAGKNWSEMTIDLNKMIPQTTHVG